MSAKEFYGRVPPPAILSTVPPEIWAAIIQFSAELDWEDSPSSDPLRSIAEFDKDYVALLRRSLVTRRYLVRVNKAWYNMAYPFLYQNILLGKGTSIEPLRRGLTKSEGRSYIDLGRTSCRSLGWWCKSLDVCMRDPALYLAEKLAALADIFSCLPNLQTLRLSPTGPGYDEILLPSGVLNHLRCTQTLKALHWYNDTLQPHSQIWADFLERFTNLESLRGCLVADRPISVNTLKTIYLEDWFKGNVNTFRKSRCTTINMPNVKYAVFPHPMRHNRIGMERILKQLLSGASNHLCLIETYLEGNPEESGVEELARILKDTGHDFPNLTQINLKAYSASDLDVSHFQIPLPSTVKILGIRIVPTVYQLTKAVVHKLLFSVILPLLRENPALKTIRFLNRRNIAILLKKFPRILKAWLSEVKALASVED